MKVFRAALVNWATCGYV